MDEIDIKKVAIAIITIVILIVGIFTIVKTINKENTKNYNLEKISEADFKYFPIYTEEKYGVIDENSNIVVKNNYSKVIIPNPTMPVFICISADGKSEVLNEKSEKIFTNYNKIEAIEINMAVSNIPYEKSVLKYEKDGKYGLIDFSGKELTQAIYESISSVKYKEGEILAKKDGKYGVLNNKGIELIPFEYDEIEADKYYRNCSYEYSGYIVKKTTNEGYRYGYINSEWNALLKEEYTSIIRILDIDSDDVYLFVSRNGQFGVIRNKNIEINFAYQSINYNKDTDLFLVQRSGQYGVVDINEKTIVPIKYKSINFNGNYILARSSAENVCYNVKGEKVENSYTSMSYANDALSYITVNEESLYGIINKNGETTVENDFLYIEYAFDNYFIALKNKKGFGVIDNEGKVYIEFKYDVLSKIGDRKILKAVDMKENITSIYSENMNEIISLSNVNIMIEDDFIELFSEEPTKYIKDNGELKTAKEILKNNKLFAVKKDNKWGFEDKDGNIKVDQIYDYVTEFNRYGFAGVKKNNKWGVINEDGNIVCECIYEFDEDEGIVKPEFIGKYYKTYNENGDIIYTDLI